MDLAFNGRLAVVTGADSGIGLHTAMTLAAEGARVLMTDLDETSLETALMQVKQHAPGAEVYSVTADVTKPDDVEKLLETAERHGGAAVLAHLAGTRGAAGDFLEIDDKGWLETFKKAGYYDQYFELWNQNKTFNKVRVLGVTTQTCNSQNWYLWEVLSDPGDELAWLEATLKDMEAKGEVAILLGHIPLASCLNAFGQRM